MAAGLAGAFGKIVVPGLQEVVGQVLGDALAPYALIYSPLRAIGTIFPDVVIEEISDDDLAITDHPVEVGATISDHAFMMPCRVLMRCGWSNSTAGTEGYVQEVYQALLALQRQREPFTVYTGKRVYTNMLIGRLNQETTQETENALMVVAGLREVIITNTQQTSSAPQSAQGVPERTTSVSDTGSVNIEPVPGIVSQDLSTSISPNAVLFGSGFEGTNNFGPIGNAASGGGFGDFGRDLGVGGGLNATVNPGGPFGG